MTRDQIVAYLSSELEPNAAFNAMTTYKRETPEMARQMSPPAKESAVMFLLFPRNGVIHTLFMQRPDNQGVHSNQLSFPGGKMEEGETPESTALRETFEEVGVKPENIDILGGLQEIYIPPSHFIVKPFVGWMQDEPQFIASHDEVMELIEYPLASLLQEPLIQEKEIFLPRYNVNFMSPYFDIHGKTLWGATAMMVQEFRMRAGFSK